MKTSSLILLTAALLPSLVRAATHTWIGGTPSNIQWTNSVQWQGGSAPNPGNGADDLIFGPVAAGYLSNTNDFAADTDFNSLAFSAPGYVILGNPFDVTAGITSTHAAAGLTIINPAVTLLANQQWQVSGAASGVLTLNGLVKLSGNQLQLGGIGTTRSLAGFAGTQANSRLVKNGSGVLVVGAASTVVGTTTINNGTVILNGSLADSAVTLTAAGATLGGEQSVTVQSLTVTAGTVRPGFTESGLESGRRLTVSSGLAMNNAAAGYTCSLGGLTAGTQHDQIRVNSGTVNLTGAALTVSLDAGFTPLGGDQFTILEAPGVAAITGTFSGKAEGSTFAVGASTFRINYTGGDGNDVVLTTAVPATGNTRTWTGLGPDAGWSRAGNWSGNTLPVPGDALVFPAGAARLVNVNDFAAGRTYQSITFGAGGYSISGNSIALNTGITAVTNASTITLATPLRVLANQSWTLNNGGGTSVLDLTTAATVEVLPGVVLTANPAAAACALALHGVISGDGGLAKEGTGTLALDAANTYRGPTTVTRGLLSAENGNALGANGGGTTVDGVSGPVLKFAVNNMTVTEPLTIGNGTLQTGLSSFTLNAPVSLTAASATVEALFATTNANLNGVISGSGKLNKTGPGTVTLGGTQPNTLTGGAQVNEAALALHKTAALRGAVIVGDGSGAASTALLLPLRDEALDPAASVTVRADGVWTLETFNQMLSGGLTLEQGLVTSSTGMLNLNGPLSTLAAVGASELAGRVTLFGNHAWTVPDGAAPADLRISAEVSSAFYSQPVKTGAGRIDWTGTCQVVTGFRQDEGTLNVTGDCSGLQVGVAYGSSLTGTGRVRVVDLTYVGSSGILAPGGGTPGIFTTNSLFCGPALPGGTLRMQINGAAAGTGYDQVVVTSINSSQFKLENGDLEVLTSTAYAPGFGQEFMLIDNQTPDPITTYFANAPEGTVFTINGKDLQLTYSGGDGNDVALTGITPSGVTRAWTGGGANNNWTTAANWGGTAPVAGDRLLFPDGALRRTNVNNFAAGTQFDFIRFTGGGYTITGNRVALLNGLAVDSITDPVSCALPLDLAQSQVWSFGNARNYPVTLSGEVNLGAFDLGFAKAGGPVLSGVVSGAGSLTVNCGGLTLSGANTFTGITTIQAGRTVVLTNAAGLGAASAGTELKSGAVVEMTTVTNCAEPFTLEGGTLRSAVNAANLNGAVTLNSGANSLDVPLAANSMICSGVFSGSATLRKTGAGSLAFTTTSNHTMTGAVTLERGLTNVNKPGGTGLSNDITILNLAELRLGSSGSLRTAGNVPGVKVQPGGLFNLNGFTQTAGRLTLTGGTVDTGAATGVLVADRITVEADGTLAGIVGSGSISAVAGAHFIVADGRDGSDLLVGVPITNALSGDVTKTGAGAINFSAANTVAAILVEEGEAEFSSSSAGTSTVIVKNAVVSGSGKVAALTLDAAATGARIEPGTSPGRLTTNSLTAAAIPSGTLQIEIAGATAVTQHDQVQIDTSAAPDPLDLSGLNLAVSLTGGFIPALNSTFRIVENLSTDTTIGTFRSLAEGATINTGRVNFTVSYTGGDVVLTAASYNGTDRTWTGAGANNNWSTAANWQGSIVPQTGDRLIFPAAGARKTNVNDLAADTVFTSLSFSHGSYNISGARVTVLESIIMNHTSGTMASALPVKVTEAGIAFTMPASPASVTWSGELNLNGVNTEGTGRLTIVGNGTISGFISGEGTTQYDGGGTLTLSGATAAVGPKFFNAGTVIFASGGNFLAGFGTSIAPGATLQIATASPVAASLSLRGTLSVSVPAAQVSLVTLNVLPGSVVNVPAGNSLQLVTANSADGELTKTGGGSLSLSGTFATSGVLSPIVVNDGSVVLGRQLSAGAILPRGQLLPRVIIIGDGSGTAGSASVVFADTEQLRDSSTITIKPDGLLDLAGFDQTLTGSISLEQGLITSSGGALTMSGTLTTVAGANPAEISGTLHLAGPATWTIADGAAAADLKVTAEVTAGGSPRITKAGAGRLDWLGNSSSDYELSATAGTLQFAGVHPEVRVFGSGGATIGGTGTFARMNAKDGTAATLLPGNASPGLIETSSLYFGPAAPGGTLRVQLNGPAPGTGYDQIRVLSGSIVNAVRLDNATLEVVTNTGYQPGLSQVFTIIDNQSTDTALGTFAGAAEGATFTVNGRQVQLSYIGGDGNDVTLTGISVTGTQRTWTGGGADNNWTTAANWGGTAPIAGDRLLFPEGAARTTNVNNLTAGTSFDSITFGGGYSISGNALALVNGFAVNAGSGNVFFTAPVALTQSQNWNVLNGPVSVFSCSGGVNLGAFDLGLTGASSRVSLGGIISGTGGLTFGAGVRSTLYAANTFTGPVTILSGADVQLEDLGGLGSPAAGTTLAAGAKLSIALSGTLSEPVTSQGGTISAGLPSGTFAGALTLTSGVTRVESYTAAQAYTITGLITGPGTLQKSGPGTLTLAGTGNNLHAHTTVAGGLLLLQKSGGVAVRSTEVTASESPATVRQLLGGQFSTGGTLLTLREDAIFDLNGFAATITNVTLAGGTILTGAVTGDLTTGDLTVLESSDTATITGPGSIRLGSEYTWTIADGTAAPDLLVTAPIEGSGAALLTKRGPGVLRSTAVNTITGIRAEEGEIICNGDSPATAVTVAAAATLSGSGRVASVSLDAAAGARITPGTSPGRLTTGSLAAPATADGTLVIEINGPAAGTQYDQVQIDAGGGSLDLSGLTLRVRIDNGYAPAPGTVFRIIENFSADASAGTFAGLPEGATITSGPIQFTISYTGGDAVLTTTANLGSDRTWTGLGANNNWSTPANWQGSIVPGYADRLIFPAGAARQTNVNDLPADTMFNSLTIAASTYLITGNRIGILQSIAATHTSSLLYGDLPLTLGGPVTISAAETTYWRGAIQLNEFDLTLAVENGGLSGAVSGSGGLIIDADTFFSFDTANTYTGPTRISGGVILIYNVNAFGSFNSGTETSPGTTLQAFVSGIQEPLVLSGRVYLLGGNQTYAGPVEIRGPESSYDIESSGAFELTGTLSGSGKLKVTGGGTLTLSGTTANSHTGTTHVTGATLVLNKPAGSPAIGPDILIGAGGGGTLRLARENQLADDTNLSVQSGTFNLNGF